MTACRLKDLENPVSRRKARKTASRLSQHATVAESRVSDGPTEKRKLASRNIMEGVVAVNYEVPSSQYACWSLARRRAWDRRFVDPYSYFYHYCHPKFDARFCRWSIKEHCLFLSAISRIPPIEKNWPVVSLLVPGRTGSDCRRYYHRIGRAGLITVRGTLRKRLFCRASVSTFDNDGKRKGRLSSSNPLFRRSALRRFLPSVLPPVDESLLKPFKSQPVFLSEEQLDALTHIPTHYEEYDRKRVVKNIVQSHSPEGTPEKQKSNLKIPCRIALRPSTCSGAAKSLAKLKIQKPQAGAKHLSNNRVEAVPDCREDIERKTADLSSPRPTKSAVRSTNRGDVEDIDFVMDMVPVDESEYSQHQLEGNLEIYEADEKIGQGNKKRVLAPSSSERATISFLVNNEEGEPEAKQPRVMKRLFSGSIQKCQSANGDKVEEIGCLLRIFAETVDETGKVLGHHFERNRLLQRYNDYVTRVRSGVEGCALFHAARLLPPTGERDTLRQVGRESLHCSRCLYDNLDNWRRQLNDMMERQCAELTSALRIAQVMYV